MLVGWLSIAAMIKQTPNNRGAAAAKQLHHHRITIFFAYNIVKQCMLVRHQVLGFSLWLLLRSVHSLIDMWQNDIYRQ
jgi:hypothetical protein